MVEELNLAEPYPPILFYLLETFPACYATNYILNLNIVIISSLLFFFTSKQDASNLCKHSHIGEIA